MTRLLMAMLMVPLAGAWSVATEEEAGANLPSQVGIKCELLTVGKRGTRSLAAQRVILEPGMSGRVEFDLPARASGRGAPVAVAVELASQVGEPDSLLLSLTGDVTEMGTDEPQHWPVQRRVEVRLGTSALVELAPPDARGQRLALSLTLAEATGERITVPLRRIDLDVEVAAVEGKEVVVLEHPLLRSLTGEMVAFGVDYQVPGDDGRTFEHVRLDLELTPGFLRGGQVPLAVALSCGFPSPTGPALVSRSDLRLLRPGETWELAVRPPQSGGGPWLRVRMTALWNPAEDGHGADGS